MGISMGQGAGSMEQGAGGPPKHEVRRRTLQGNAMICNYPFPSISFRTGYRDDK